MVLINGVAMWCWLLLAQRCQAMPIFGLQLAESLPFTTCQQIRAKLMALMTLMKPNEMPLDH
jgi:hypothetical protein